MRGFTLVEMVITLAIIATTLGLVVTSYKTIGQTRTVVDASRVYAYALREASMRAASMEYDSAWGTKIATSTVTVFSGATYATRTAARDHIYSIDSSVTFSGSTESDFAKFTGLPGAAGTTTIGNGLSTSTVTVGAGGAVGFTP